MDSVILEVLAGDFAAKTPRLFLFPHAGGMPMAYRRLAQRLAPGLCVVGVLYPARGRRVFDAPAASVAALAAQAAPAILANQDHPLGLFGHSMGAFVAYEVALILERAGCFPQHLFLSSARAPHLAPRAPCGDYDDRRFSAALVELGATPAALLDDEEARELLLPMLRADFRAAEQYRRALPGVALACPASLIHAKHDHAVDTADVLAWLEHPLPWCQVLQVPGGHFHASEAPEAICAQVRRHLDAPPPWRAYG